MSGFLRTVAPIVVLLGAGGIAAAFVMTSSRPKRKPKAPKAAVVEVMSVRATTSHARVEAMGTIIPSQTVMMRSEVTGRVTHQCADLLPGGRVKKGEVLLRIDARDYALAVKEAEARVQKSTFEMKLEKGRQQIAAHEWKLVGNPEKTTDEGRALVLREPHLESVRADLASSKSALERAQLNVSRTVIRAPFNALITEEKVDVGQLVGPQGDLMKLVGTDTFWVQVSVGVSDLQWVRLPGPDEPGSPVLVAQEIGGRTIRRDGRVIRLLGDLDPKGRMARLLVEIDNPLDGPGDETLPLLLGSYVRVDIEGHELSDVFEIPRTALREGDVAWIARADDTLEIRDVHVRWRSRNAVFIDRGLSERDRVITSRLAAPVPTMKVRLADGADSPAGEPAARSEADAPSPVTVGRP